MPIQVIITIQKVLFPQTPEIEQQVENSVVKNGGGHDDPIVID